MATFQKTFLELYGAVSDFLGTYGSSGPSGADLTEAKAIANSGYLKFLMVHPWSFRRRFTTLSIVSGEWNYELPADYTEMITKFTFPLNSGYPQIEERSIETLMQLRAEQQTSSYPEYFATQVGTYAPETGQRNEVCFWPTPNGDWTLHYGYKIIPNKLVNDTDVCMGGPEMSECIEQFCLAMAETKRDEKDGVQSKMAKEALMGAIAADNAKNPKFLGYGWENSRTTNWEMARGSYRVNDVNYTP